MKLALSALMLAVVAVSAGCISQLDKPLAGFSIKYSELPGTNDHDRTTTTITVSGNGSITSSRGGIIKEGKLSIEEMGQLVQKTLLSGLFSRVLDRGENCNKIPEAGSTLLEVNLAGETRSVESSCPTKEVGELITYLQALAERIVEKNAGEFDLSMVSDEGLERFYEFRISGNGSVELVTHDSRKWRSLSRQELGDLQGVIRENNFFDADLHDPLAGACVAVSVLLPSRSLTISMDGRTRNVEMNVCPLAPGFRNIESRLSRIEESLVGVTYVEQADGTAYWEITGNDSGFEESVLRVQTFNRGNARQLIVSGDEIPSEKAREISGSRWVIERDENHSKSRNTCLACGICGSYEPYVWVSSAGVVIRGFHPQCSEDIVPEVSLEGRTIRIQPRKFSLSFQTRNDVGLITFKVSENGSAELITSDAHYWDNLTQAQLKELKARVRDSSFFTLKDERSGCPLKGPHESICATQETARITVNADGKSHSVWSDDPLVPTIDTSRSRELAELMSGLYNLRGYYPYNDTSHGQVAWQHGVEYVMRGGKQYWKDTMEQERPREQEAFSRLLVVGLLLNNSSLPSSDILNAEWVIQPDERYSMGVCAACGICPSPQKYKWVTSNGYEIWGYRPQCTEEWVIMLQWPGLDKSVELYNG